jgi:SAM-dependent methyltransferase
MAAVEQANESIAQEQNQLVERVLQSTLGMFDVFAIYLGERLGFYQALAAQSPLSPAELAARTGTHERYAREWLEQQAVTGILRVAEEADAGTARRFALPAGHAEVLADPDSLNYMASLARLAVGAVHPLAAVLQAYREGGGVPYHQYGEDLREGQAAVNRPAFLQLLGSEWLPSIPDVHARLQADPPARVADIGCGAGWSSIGIARGYPKARVDGYDLDEASVELAKRYVREAGLEDRVTIHLRDSSDPSLVGQYELVTAFECIHDMSDPVGALRTMRGLAGEQGAVLVEDERVADRFMGDGGDAEPMMYGWSVFHCLPVGMADQPSAATGTVMRTGTLRAYARKAGFREVEVLPIDNFFFRFYRLHP